MVTNEKQTRGLRLLQITRYAKTLKNLPEPELRRELVHYIRRNYGVSDGTIKSYLETTIARLDIKEEMLECGD